MTYELKTTAEDRASVFKEGCDCKTCRMTQDIAGLLSERSRWRREAMEECAKICSDNEYVEIALHQIRELAAKEAKEN